MVNRGEYAKPAQVALYDDIYDEYLEALIQAGIILQDRALGEAGWAARTKQIESLCSKGATSRNAGSSVFTHELSSACMVCPGGSGSQTFAISHHCHRQCYFCFNPNQSDYEQLKHCTHDVQSELDQLHAAGRQMTHFGLTGGEPLLYRRETLDFLHTAHSYWPNAHLRIYTTGEQLDATYIKELAEVGLTEIRFSVKTDDPSEVQQRMLETLAATVPFIPQVMVEMPVIPRTGKWMRELLLELDRVGAFGINLLEFCFPFNNWPEFEKRGFQIRNPPYHVLFDYLYAGGLPVAGSENLALDLVEFALDEQLDLAVQYCSLEHKHRDQIHRINTRAAARHSLYTLDPEDFFLKSIKVFGDAVPVIADFFRSVSEGSYAIDNEDHSLNFRPALLDIYKSKMPNVCYYQSFNVSVPRGATEYLRELAVIPL